MGCPNSESTHLLCVEKVHSQQEFEHQSVLQQFINAGQGNKYDLSDLLIVHSATEQGCEAVLTFDKKASQYQLFELVK